MVSFLKRCYSSFVLGGASKGDPFSRLPLLSAPQKTTIYKPFYSRRNLKKIVKPNNFFPMNFRVWISDSEMFKIGLEEENIFKLDFDWQTKPVIFSGNFIGWNWFETLQKFAWPLFLSKFGKGDVYLRFRAENFWVKRRFWQWLLAEHE